MLFYLSLLLSVSLYYSLMLSAGLYWFTLVSTGLPWSLLYLGAVEQQQHVVQRPPLSGQLFPQGVDGGGVRSRACGGVEVKGHRAGESMDGAIRQEAGRSRFLQ